MKVSPDLAAIGGGGTSTLLFWSNGVVLPLDIPDGVENLRRMLASSVVAVKRDCATVLVSTGVVALSLCKSTFCSGVGSNMVGGPG